jgi:photosystem II stability/assembly factor-like uncharacterized protein
MKNALLFTFTFFILILFNDADLFAQEYQDWKFTHPRPQANNLRKMQMIDVNTWVATGANGTYMKTTDGGVTWFFHHQAGRYSNAAKAISQNYDIWFFNANNGFLAGDRGYIGKTTNGGSTFDSVGIGIVPVTQRCQGIWFANQDTGYIVAGSASGSAGTITRTIDGGANWTSVYTYSSSFTAVWGTNSQTVYAVAADGSVFKTTNGGQNWNQNSLAVGIFMYSMGFVDQNTGFVVGGGGLMSRTTNAGVTWTPLTPPQVDFSLFHINIISATEIYAAGHPQFLYKTTDLGNTWQPLTIMPVSGPSSTYIWYAMDMVGGTMTLSGDFGVVAKSTDGGLTWSSNQFSLTTQLLFDIELIPTTNNLLAVGRQYTTGTRQVFFSSDYGTNWTSSDLGVDMNASSISMVNSQVGYISGTNCQVLKTTNGGVNWSPVTQPIAGTNDLASMEFVSPDTGWVFSFSNISGGSIFKTTNGGSSWTQQTNTLTNGIYSADMVDANIGYHTINSSNRPIYKTTDGGTNWVAVTTPLTGNITSIKALDANTIIIGASSGTTRMAKTTDGGTNWTPITLPIAVDIRSLDFMDADTGYVCGNTTTVALRTTNGGTNWTFENLHLPALVKIRVLPNDIAYAFGTYGSIMRYDPHGYVPVELTSFTSSVSGSNVLLKWQTASELNNMGFEIERASANTLQEWKKVGFVAGSGTTTEIRSYSYLDNNLKTGTYYYRLKQIDYDGTFNYSDEIEVEVVVPFNFALEQNYPNPFNPTTIIRYSVPENSLVNIKVYNIIGQEVAELLNEVKSPDRYEINFEAKGLASGIYLVKMQAGDFTSTIKITLLK